MTHDFVAPGSRTVTTLRSRRDRRVELLIVAIVCVNLIVYFGKQLWTGVA